MELTHVLLIAVICLFIFAMGCLFVLYMMKRAAVVAVNAVVDKTINKASEMMSEKVLDPTMAVATDGMRKGINAVGQAVKDEYQDSKRRTPANIDIEVTGLAKRLRGKVTTADVTSQLKLSSKEAKDAFKRLKGNGDCVESPQGHYVVYLFGAFLQKVRVWRCGYCSAQHTEDPKRGDCASCGGRLEITEEAMA